MSDTCTLSELEAFQLLCAAGWLSLSTDNTRDAHWAANKIIELAEKIKAERAVVAMQE